MKLVHWSGIPTGVCYRKDYFDTDGLVNALITEKGLPDQPRNVSCPTCKVWITKKLNKRESSPVLPPIPGPVHAE